MPDLRLLRSSLAAFADVVELPLADWQARTFTLETRVTVVVAPRQTGKSRSLTVLALWRAFREPGHRVLVISAGEEASRRLLGEVRRVAMASALLSSSVVDESAALLTLANGSEIRSVPASERQTRGWTVDTLLVDEAAMVGDDLLLGAALPTTAARPDARIVLASSPLTAGGAFFDHAVRGEGGSVHVRTRRWRLPDAEWISPSVIEAARESMSEARFRCEFEGEFASGSDVLISRVALDRATAPYDLDHLGEMTGPARASGGLDWGFQRDRSAFVAVGRMAGTDYRFGVRVARRWDAGAPIPDVIGELAACPGALAYLVAEANQAQGALVEMLFEAWRRRPPELGGLKPAPPSRLVDLDQWGDFVGGAPAPL